MKEYRLDEQNRRKRKKRMWRMKLSLTGMAIAVFLLIIYIIYSLISLIAKTIEYREADLGNQVVQDAPENPDNAQETSKDVHNVQEQGDELLSDREIIMEKLETFALEHNFSVDEYPVEMMELLEKNPETEEFVLNYPLQKGNYSQDSLNTYLNDVQVPLFLQWDSRWGYYEYGDKPMGITGCGPTCLSMVALHLLQNPQMTPVYMADFAQQNGFYVEGTGTAWTFMSQGATELGLYAQEVSLDEELVLYHLSQGRPIICAMGPGDFTDQGHFIVFVGMKDGKIIVNDPNSKVRSGQLWNFEDIKYQIKNMWAYSVR